MISLFSKLQIFSFFTKFHILTFISILLYTASYGQKGNFSISGQVVDSINNQPVEFASVAIYKLAGTVLITGTITNANGEFVLNKLNSGKYIIKSSFVGYQINSTIVEISNVSVNLSKPIYLSGSSISLNEVEVTGTPDEKQITIEKTKINVAQNLSAVSGNITDVLKSQSSITIDADNIVYLRGNKNILILMDGIPTTMTTLNAIPSSTIDYIEIITNPDAKYDAEGTGGIINIITKQQSMPGLNAAATLNFGIYDRINGGLSVNYNRGIWILGLSYNGKYENPDIRSHLSRELKADKIFIEQDIYSEQKNKTHNAAMFLVAQPNKKETFTLDIKTVFPYLSNNQEITGIQYGESTPETSYFRENEITYHRKSFESAFSYKNAFVKSKHEISVGASFSRTKGSRPAEYFIEGELLQKSSGGGAPTNATMQVDYLKLIFGSGIMECGVKVFSRWNSFDYSFYDLDTTNGQWVLNPLFSNDLEHREYIYSGYLTYTDSLFKKVFMKIGGRLEYNNSDLIQKSLNDSIYKEYFFPFPFLQLKYNIKKDQNIALSINRRITRPTYPQLNPFINVIDQMTYETGNKSLNPEILDKIEFNYSLIQEKFQFRTNLYASTTRDFITQVSMLSGSDTLIITYVNGDRQYKIGGDFDFTFQFGKYLSVNPAFTIFHTRSYGQYNEVDLSTNDWAWTGNVRFLIKPEKRTEIQLFLNYNSPVALPQFELSEIYYADIGIKRFFFDNRFSVSLTLTDIFDTRKWEIQSDNAVYNLENKSKGETRILWVGLTYNFNSFKVSKTQKNGGNENEDGMIKLGQ